MSPDSANSFERRSSSQWSGTKKASVTSHHRVSADACSCTSVDLASNPSSHELPPSVSPTKTHSSGVAISLPLMIKLNERTTRKVGFCAGTIESKVRCVPPHLHLDILATSKQWADRSLGSDTLSLAHERKVESRGQGLVQFTRFTTNSTALQVEAMHLHTRLIPRIPVTGQKVNAFSRRSYGV